MQPIGERLREARIRQGRDVTEVEAATKIRAKYLRALENDEFAMLPGNTYVKSFLRTYAEYLGLDAHLLVEEFRAQHEPRGEEEVPSFAPPARARPPHERRMAGPGMAISPGVLLAGGVLAILVLLAIIGLASGGGGGGGKRKSASHAGPTKTSTTAQRPRPVTPTVLREVKLSVVPTETTYVCVDDGRGTRLFEGTISTPRSFRGKRLRINLGRSSANLFVNGKPFSFTRTSSSVGFSFSRTGRATSLPALNRPCV
jgi:transcriptional regulator with XRE-family HTH domain